MATVLRNVGRSARGRSCTHFFGGKLRGSFRAPTLRAVALATGITLLGGASAHAAVSQKVTADRAVARSCHDRYVDGASGTQSVTTTAPDTGLIRARLSGGGDWDLGVFDASSGRSVAGSAAFGSNELAEGFVKQGQKLRVQACRFRGSAASAALSVGFVKIAERSTGKVQVVDVDTIARKDKRRLQSLGLDLTEHGDTNSVEVVLHGAADERTLRDAGFTFDVRIADLEARSKANRTADSKFAASNPKTQLPSGSNQYRRLADYDLEMKQLAMRYPALVKELTLNHPTIEGRSVNGIEITQNPAAKDGKPIFLQLGVHHAREWPSSEHAIEFAYDLLTNYGTSGRTTELVNSTRTIVVPIVNVDGFNISREAPHAGLSASFGLFDYEMKRKNCRISEDTPAQYSDRHVRRQRRRAAARHRPEPQLRRAVGRERRQHQLVGRHIPRRRAVLRARDAEHPRAAVDAVDHEPDHEPHVLEPVAAPAGRGGHGRPARGVADQGARRADGEPQRLRQHPGLRPLRHDGRHGGLDVLDRRLARVHVRDRSERVPSALQQRRRGRVPRPRPDGRRRQGRQPRGLLRDAGRDPGLRRCTR